MSHRYVRYETIELLTLCYQMTAHCRDVENGKGERDLFYMLLTVWSKYNIQLCNNLILNTCVDMGQRCLGYWKDPKNIANYFNSSECTNKEIVVNYVVELYSQQLLADYINLYNLSNGYVRNVSLSLCAKYCPREGQKQYKWLAKLVAHNLFEKLRMYGIIYSPTINTGTNSNHVF